VNGRGLHRPTPSRVAHRLGAHTLGLSGTPRGSATLEPCPRMDQGRTSTCHAHSAIAAFWTALTAAGQKPSWVASPLLLASCAYADVRALLFPAPQALPTLVDTGAELQDDATALAKWGVAPMGALIQWRSGLSDVPDNRDGVPFPEPDRTQLEIAGSDLISGEYSIAVDSNAPRLVALALDAGIPVWDGGYITSDYERISAGTVAPASMGQDDGSGGGHAQYISAYRTNSAGAYEYLYQNSWGDVWAMGGAVWVSTAFLLTRWTLWPFAVKS
jgi:hypothetical protein